MAIEDNGMNYTTLRQIINDFIVTMDGDDYVSNVSDAAIRNIALRGIRELGFDVTSRVKSIRRTVDTSNNTIALPDDYVDIIKIGAVDSDGILRVFGENKNINYSRKIKTTINSEGAEITSNTDFLAGPLDIPENEVLDRVDDKTATSNTSSNDYDYYIFENYIFEGGLGRMYGLGGGHLSGEYRVNLDQNRIEIDSSSNTTDVIIEYVSDEARSSNPVIHVYAEEALRSYMYYKLCERKTFVPANEKARARSEYYNERRIAKARLGNFSKDEALKTIRKNFRLSPKY